MELDKELLQKIIDDLSMSSRETVAEKYDVSERVASYYWFISQNMGVLQDFFETDGELVEQNVRYQKQKQKLQDFSRIERKAFREYARVENAVEEYTKGLMDVFDNNPYKPIGVTHKSTNSAVGVIQLSDLHLNELIDIATNKYDFNIASKRLYKLAVETMKYFDIQGVSDVFVFATADFLNSDRRLDELVAMATNRSKATFIGVQILENFLVHLNSKYNLHVAGVVGNESRVGKDYNWNNTLVSDNYDFTIFNVLRYKLQHTDGISFLGFCDKHEEVVEVNGKNFLLIHGHQIGKDTAKDISKLVRKYAQQNVTIHYTIYGHLHEAMVSDTYARSSALCGSNSYSEDALLLVGRSSQNIYTVFDCDRIDSIRIDLQNTDGYEGYDTKDWKDAYNPKSLDKINRGETILRITI
jgi:predicted phosphodiesterase